MARSKNPIGDFFSSAGKKDAGRSDPAPKWGWAEASAASGERLRKSQAERAARNAKGTRDVNGSMLSAGDWVKWNGKHMQVTHAGGDYVNLRGERHSDAVSNLHPSRVSLSYSNAPVQTGPRGGRFTTTSTGQKHYVGSGRRLLDPGK